MTRIRALRKERGMSISKLSQVVEVNASVISWVELGKLAASPAVRTSLSKFYREKEKALFHGSGLAI